jgi:hypothetical protein
LSSVDPLSDASLLASGVVLAPLAYMVAEVGKTIEIIIKNINEILILFIVATDVDIIYKAIVT